MAVLASYVHVSLATPTRLCSFTHVDPSYFRTQKVYRGAENVPGRRKCTGTQKMYRESFHRIGSLFTGLPAILREVRDCEVDQDAGEDGAQDWRERVRDLTEPEGSQ